MMVQGPKVVDDFNLEYSFGKIGRLIVSRKRLKAYLDGDAPFPLLRQEVHHRVPRVHLSHVTRVPRQV
jgi:hypothetical protein